VEVDVRELGGSRVTVHVRLDVGEVQGAFDRTYQQLSERGGIRGFRPGKVPRSILERHYDSELIRAVTYDALVQKRLQDALEEHKLRPIEEISVEAGAPPGDEELLAETIRSGLVAEEEGAAADEAEARKHGDDEVGGDEEQVHDEEDEDEEVPLVEGEAFEFHATFTVYPRPQLPDLSDLKLRRPVATVSDEDIDARLEELRRINAEEIDVERDTIEDGDLVTADVKVVLEDEDEDEIEPTEREITVGEGEYLGEIDQALIGHTPGDVVERPFEYGEDHPDEALRGRSGRVIAEIDSFSARKLPDLDDEFAQSLGDYETLADLRASIREQLETRAAEHAREELRGQVLRYLLENAEVEMPEEFVERTAERSYQDLRSELQRYGMSLEEFAEVAELDEEGLRANERRRAESALKLNFALEALAEELGVEVTDDDLTAELQRVAAESGGDLEFVRQAAALQPDFAEEMRDRALRRKLIDHIVDSAEIEDVPADEYEAERENIEAEAAETEDEEAPAPAAEGDAVEEAPAAAAELTEAAAEEAVQIDQESETQ